MFKVEKIVCLENVEVIAEKRMTFTEGKVYYSRRSKKGNLVIKSNEGQWVVFKIPALSYILGEYGGKFRYIRSMYFNNLKDYKQMSL